MKAREITGGAAMLSDWAVRTLVPCVLAAVGRTDADLDQLTELTPICFEYPGLLDPHIRVLEIARRSSAEALLTEHHHRPTDLPETYRVLRESLGDDVLSAADDARIAVLPHRIGRAGWAAMSAGVQLLHFRHGGHSPELQRLRDQGQTALMDLRQDLAGWALAHPADLPAPTVGRSRTDRPLPVRVPQQHRIGA